MSQIRFALEAGWKVSVVAKFLDPSLQDRVEWLRLTVPRRLFFVQWTTAHHFILKALGNRRFDVVHGHQPQVADLCDIFTCHFLTRVAYERRCLESRTGLRSRLVRLQQQGVVYAEDRCYRRWNPRTRMMFCSEMMRREFSRLYSEPPLHEVHVNPCPAVRFATPEQRAIARLALVGPEYKGMVVGYLGGVQKRKGYLRLIPAIARDENLFLLMAGPYSEGFSAPELRGRCHALGLIDDLETFYAACDVLAVPSLFEPLGLVAFEAAVHGVPVIATDEVGALSHLLDYGVGMRWQTDEPLGPVARELMSRSDAMRCGAARMANEFSEHRHGDQLLAAYDRALRSKPHAAAASSVI